MTGALNDHTCTHVRALLPRARVWHAELELAENVALAVGAAAELVVADLTLTGTILSGGPGKTSALYRVAGGAGGWGRTIPARDYVNDAGVKILTVARDAADAVGETLDLSTVPAGVLGAKWERLEGPASDVLELVAPAGWHIGIDGVTRFGVRPQSTYTGEATRQDVDLAMGRIELASDAIADILPGSVVDGLEAVDVEHRLTPEDLRTTVYGARGSLAGALGELVAKLLPQLRYLCPYEYRVNTREGELLNLTPVRSALGLPVLKRCRVMPGVSGARADVAPGSTVIVAFLNGDPRSPRVVGFESAGFPGFRPARLDLVGEDDDAADVVSATKRNVRYGDMVSIPVVGGGGGTAVGLVSPAPAAVSFSRVRS